MPDTCPACGRTYAIYSEGHSPGSTECLDNQKADVEREITRLNRQNAELRECLKVKDEALRLAKHKWALRFAKTTDEINTMATPFDKALAAQPEVKP